MMRHADSEESGEGRDHDRSITEAGRADAKQVRLCTAYRAPLMSAALGRDQYAVHSSVLKCLRGGHSGVICVTRCLVARHNGRDVHQNRTWQGIDVSCIVMAVCSSATHPVR